VVSSNNDSSGVVASADVVELRQSDQHVLRGLSHLGIRVLEVVPPDACEYLLPLPTRRHERLERLECLWSHIVERTVRKRLPSILKMLQGGMDGSGPHRNGRLTGTRRPGRSSMPQRAFSRAMWARRPASGSSTAAPTPGAVGTSLPERTKFTPMQAMTARKTRTFLAAEGLTSGSTPLTRPSSGCRRLFS